MSNVKKKTDDLWTLIEREPYDNSDEGDTTTLFVGDSGSGKSTLIQSFLKPTISKEPKATFALDYNFARRKAASSSSSSHAKNVAHIWELGGDISEPRLLEVPLTVGNLATSAVVICCDLSKPNNCLASLLKWIKLIRNVVDLRLKELQATNSIAAAALKEAASLRCKGHDKDSKRLSPLEVSLYIVANKYDAFKSQSSADRRCLMQVLRFVAHYHGATLLTTSSTDASLKESFRSHMTGICFRTSSKVVCDAVLEKPIFITAGKDDFEAILLASHRSIEEGDRAVTSASSTSGKSRLASSTADLTLFLSPQGVTRDCWSRLQESTTAVFGAPDIAEEKATVDEYESGNTEEKVDNDFPESDVDDMRAQMDSALLRYIAAAERKELIQEKEKERERGGGAKKVEDRGEDEGDEEGRKAAKDREKKRSSSRKS